MRVSLYAVEHWPDGPSGRSVLQVYDSELNARRRHDDLRRAGIKAVVWEM